MSGTPALDLSYLVLSYDAAAGAGGSIIVTSSSAAAGSVLASSAGSIARGAGNGLGFRARTMSASPYERRELCEVWRVRSWRV